MACVTGRRGARVIVKDSVPRARVIKGVESLPLGHLERLDHRESRGNKTRIVLARIPAASSRPGARAPTLNAITKSRGQIH
jgi:hypothetical protein